jgi:hypothetical protein
MDHKLSPHFTLAELTLSQKASRLGLDNRPASDQILANLAHTAEQMELVRAFLGNKPITVSSGYRSPAVNRAVGGAQDSAHILGHAVDFICPAYGSPIDICRHLALQPTLVFDQIIQEGTWVHISFDRRARRQLLTKQGGGYAVGIHQAS